MKRREFFQLVSVSGPLFLSGCSSLRKHLCSSCFSPFEKPSAPSKPTSPPAVASQPLTSDGDDFAEIHSADHHQAHVDHSQLQGQSSKSTFFDQDFSDDIFFTGAKFQMVQVLARKLSQVQRYVGAGNFNLVGIDEFIRYTNYLPGIERATLREKKFLEELFYFDANKYGFTGDKVFKRLTDNLKKNQTIKIPYSGHYLRKGESHRLYEKVKGDVGDTLILTSGVRAIAKQFHLFLSKSIETNGNMSKASRSLAPPGYSFHGRGDFDVGKIGNGLRNFTNDFANTDEYKRLTDLGYVNIRYTQSNLLGVRFEPWHIKVHNS